MAVRFMTHLSMSVFLGKLHEIKHKTNIPVKYSALDFTQDHTHSSMVNMVCEE